MLRRTFSAVVVALSAAIVPARALTQPTPAPRFIFPAPLEDARLAAFLDEIDLETIRLSPEQLTFRGMKERYNELGDYTEADQKRLLALVEAQLARMKREFDRTGLSDSAKLSYDLLEWLVVNYRRLTRWYWQKYTVSSSGTALDRVPTMLITSHRVDNVADAEAYVARLRAMERAAGGMSADLDERTSKGFLPPAFTFDRVIADAQNQLKGAPFEAGPDVAVLADLKSKVAALQAEPAVKARVLAGGEAALKGEWRRGYTRYIASLQAMSRKATGCKWCLGVA